MFRILSMSIFCLVILGSYSDIQAMKRTHSQEVTTVAESVSGTILSFPCELHGAIVACSQDKNALRLTCKAFHELASFAQWRVLLKMFHTILHLSTEDQERIGAILLGEDNVQLMTKLLDKYPEYAKRVPQFAFDKPLSYAISPEMKQLLEPTSAPVKLATPQDLDALCQVAMTLPATQVFDQFLAPTLSGISPEHMGSFTQSQPFVTLCENTSPVFTLAYRINNVFLLDNVDLCEADKKQMKAFYHAILKGDSAYIKDALQSSTFKDTLAICDPLPTINYALQLAALCGYYDIVALLLQEPALPNFYTCVGGQVLYAALGILRLDLGNNDSYNDISCVVSQTMRPHEKIAELIIADGRIKEELYEYLVHAITADNPAIVNALVKTMLPTPTYEELAYAKEAGNAEIIKIIETAIANKKSD